MTPMGYRELLQQMLLETREKGTCFYVPVVSLKEDKQLEFCNKKLESPIGPAAGPHTQMAQNLLAAYVSGGRFFELKTVQILEGEDLGINKPCIYVKDEAYNIEWSTELTVEDAFNEYVKAWFLIHLAAKEYSLGRSDGFVFNMSVGYDLDGIKSKKMDAFIEGLKDAGHLPIFQECKRISLEFLSQFQMVDETFIEEISSDICNSITLSTMHGCPPEQIEQIAMYLLKEKQLHTYIKCNPTLLGVQTVKCLLKQSGYEFLAFSDHQFETDLKKEEAVALIKRCMQASKEESLSFGVKLTNTFPVESNGDKLQGEIMYLSGKPLFPLAIAVANLLNQEFQGTLPISFSGGVDMHQVAELFETGVYPITAATLLLKQGGYQNITKLKNAIFQKIQKAPGSIVVDQLQKLSEKAAKDMHYQPQKQKESKQRNQKKSPFTCHICKSCVDVCPNRANVPMDADGIKQTIHLDALCNECGNCSCFCPLGFEPYKDKFTSFASKQELLTSQNNGFAWLDHEKEQLVYRLYEKIYEGSMKELQKIPKEIIQLLTTIKEEEKKKISSF